MERKEEKRFYEELDRSTDNPYRIDVRDYLSGVTGGVTLRRIDNLNRLLKTLNPDELKRLRIEECADEKTGKRYGLAKKRLGKARKIGGGGRNKGSRYAYQIWAVFS